MKNQPQAKSIINSTNCSPWCHYLFVPLIAGASLLLAAHARAQCASACEDSLRDTALGTNASGGGFGSNNSALGYSALSGNLFGSANTAIGSLAISVNFTGSSNTAIGAFALTANVGGNYNVAAGANALYSNTNGSYNTALGEGSLNANTTGNNNTATGLNSLFFNTTGHDNTAAGLDSLFSNTTGSSNVAEGSLALYHNTTGTVNTAMGYNALYSNISGGGNTATGRGALYFTTASNNTAFGLSALYNNTTGSNNIAVGNFAGSNLQTGSNNIDIGALGAPGDANTIRLGRVGVQTAAYMIGVHGATVAGGVGVVVDGTGHLGTITSSARYKDNIQPMDKASEAILALKPVTFRYKKELDSLGIPQFGLVAEQVEKVDPDLVARDESGKPYSVRYEAVNAMLLNEFLKEHRKVETQSATIAQQQATIAQWESNVAEQRKEFIATAAKQQKEIEALTAGLQKVSNQVELTNAPRRVAANGR